MLSGRRVFACVNANGRVWRDCWPLPHDNCGLTNGPFSTPAHLRQRARAERISALAWLKAAAARWRARWSAGH